jgi:hypothetical protein
MIGKCYNVLDKCYNMKEEGYNTTDKCCNIKNEDYNMMVEDYNPMDTVRRRVGEEATCSAVQFSSSAVWRISLLTLFKSQAAAE